MGVPAFFRWLSEKYPKIVQDVLEERVLMIDGDGSSSQERVPFDATRPNPSGLECDNLYIDCNGIIHPCSHPENGPQPKTEAQMFVNVCHYLDRLFRAMRPRKLLYLAIDGVAPRAKMNQQRARRFRSAQEARELLELEKDVAKQMVTDEALDNDFTLLPDQKQQPWDSNVITPGTPFMLRLAEYLRFYIRQRLATDKAWRNLRVIFSDASVPGEGEHKIQNHIRLQRAQPGYNPNLVHVLHGLDADLIMLALATHEAHFYISREEVLFGRKSMEEKDRRQDESGFRVKQQQLNDAAGEWAMTHMPENNGKPLQRISIPLLREYLHAEFFDPCLNPATLPFKPSLERLIDDIVFLCFFVGNDFLPHLPSLDIRDGALDFLFNVYKRILPSLGDYMTKSGGHVNLSHVDVILQHVGAIEDYVFAMKHDNEQRLKQQREEQKKNSKNRTGKGPPPIAVQPSNHKVRGRAAKILEQRGGGSGGKNDSVGGDGLAKLDRGHAAKERNRIQQKEKRKKPTVAVSASSDDANRQAALAFKQSLMGNGSADAATKTTSENKDDEKGVTAAKDEEENKRDETDVDMADAGANKKRKATKVEKKDKKDETTPGKKKLKTNDGTGVGVVGEAEDEFDNDGAATGEDDDDVDDDEENGVEKALEAEVAALAVKNAAAAASFKEKVKAAQQKQLDEYAANVQDNVRLHEAGWKDRYYSDKCKADDVAAHGGREHLFRSYVVGLCWVMKYYYDGCPSWKWYFPFHYAPFASDLKNIERFQPDVRALELAKPFHPVEQLMAVLPSDSSHAIPKASRWLMLDEESPILDFYPKDVPVDPNGKAMPWLWVVLLPFIDEQRLLDAMMPTMAKWSKEELLCNARGLDDGYLYIHKAHPLSKKFAPVLAKGKSAKSPKTRLTNAAAHGAPGFFGSVRPPLSNELHPVDEETKITLPPTAGEIDEPSPDGLFTDDIHVNFAVCVAFSEPTKLPHKSVLLPGARPVPPSLTEEDKRIRRPRLGRGGTIANMGGSGGVSGSGGGNHQSHQVGYGSVNITSYERDLAHQQGRGHEMYKPGTRQWGAMDPVPKQFQHGVRRGPSQQQPPQHQPPPNPFMNQQHPQQQQPPWNQAGQPQQNYRNNGYNASQQHQQQRGGYQQQGQQPWQQQHEHQQQYQQQGGYNNNNSPQPQGHVGAYSSQNGPSQQHHNRGPQQQHPPQQRQGFSFRNHNYGGQHNQQQQQQHNSQAQRSRTSADAMQSLRAQLSSTLRNNRKPGGGPN